MRAALAPLVAVPLLLTACSDDDPGDSGTTPFLPDATTPTDAATPAGPATKVFDEAALEGPNGVMKILVDDYKIENVETVDCPADQEVKQGNKFTCLVTIGGDEPKELTVDITVNSDDGEYQVALPEER